MQEPPLPPQAEATVCGASANPLINMTETIARMIRRHDADKKLRRDICCAPCWNCRERQVQDQCRERLQDMRSRAHSHLKHRGAYGKSNGICGALISLETTVLR